MVIRIWNQIKLLQFRPIVPSQVHPNFSQYSQTTLCSFQDPYQFDSKNLIPYYIYSDPEIPVPCQIVSCAIQIIPCSIQDPFQFHPTTSLHSYQLRPSSIQDAIQLIPSYKHLISKPVQSQILTSFPSSFTNGVASYSHGQYQMAAIIIHKC